MLYRDVLVCDLDVGLSTVHRCPCIAFARRGATASRQANTSVPVAGARSHTVRGPTPARAEDDAARAVVLGGVTIRQTIRLSPRARDGPRVDRGSKPWISER